MNFESKSTLALLTAACKKFCLFWHSFRQKSILENISTVPITDSQNFSRKVRIILKFIYKNSGSWYWFRTCNWTFRNISDFLSEVCSSQGPFGRIHSLIDHLSSQLVENAWSNGDEIFHIFLLIIFFQSRKSCIRIFFESNFLDSNVQFGTISHYRCLQILQNRSTWKQR